MTKEELKEIITVPEVLERYGVDVKRGRCKAICHDGKNYTAKVSRQLYFCFKCNKSMDIFDIVMHFNSCDFYTAFQLLGGSSKPIFRSYVKTKQIKTKKKNKQRKASLRKEKLKQINLFIDTYRRIIKEEEREDRVYSELWCYCQHKLPYQIYLQEYYTEMR